MTLEALIVAALGATAARPIGSGSYGDTYLVDAIPGLGGPHAVKVLKAASYDQRRVDREMAGMRRYRGDGVAQLLDVRTVTIEDAQHVALVCEYIAGGTASERVEAGGLPSHKHLRRFAIKLLGTVAELHADDAFHRDIKPQNILLREGKWSRPVLIDFGLYRSLSDTTITAAGMLIGSPAYMAPEHFSGEPARKAADLWACGVTLYRLAAGRHPFIPDNPGPLSTEDLLALVSGAPHPLPDNLPDDLRAVIERLLAEKPHQRGRAERAVKNLIEGASA